MLTAVIGTTDGPGYICPQLFSAVKCSFACSNADSSVTTKAVERCHSEWAPTNGQHHLRWQELPLPGGLQPWCRSCCRNEKVKLEQTDKQTTNSPRILNPHRTVTSNGDLMPWIGRNVPVATESSTRRCPGLILSPVLLLLLVAVVSDKLWALGTDNGRVRFETAGESWQCKGTHSSRSWQLLQNQLEPGADSPKSDVRTFSRLESKMTSSYGSCSSRRLCL